ncbi:hypothetical protein [Asticcacaulis solisilvae]|uniref:hypothetical protein n=1 Tax=Asticcacaulis solisilvae TaxID=1217274 RepID=UPI003FD71D93
MNNWVILAIVIAGCLVAFEMMVYGHWRKRLYEDYLSYHNNTVLPHVPEAWRKLESSYPNRIDFTLEWEMFRARLVPAMGADLIRRMKIQRAVVIGVYLPVAALIVWALFERYVLGNR